MAINYLYFWDSCTFYATVQPAAEMHAQSTVSITLSLDGGFELEVQDESGEQTRVMRELQAVFVPPGISHRVTTSGVRRVVVTLEPGSSHYDAAGSILRQERPTAIAVQDLHAPLKRLRAELAPAFQGRLDCEPAYAMFRRVLTAVVGESRANQKSNSDSGAGAVRDERVVAVLASLRKMEELPAGLGAAQLAAQVGLSTERFRRLFKAEMGLTVRRYLLWLRIRRAGAAVTEGASLTEAAHAVGFYDSAHLSRSCKEILGFPPSFITGRQVEMINCGGRNG